MVFVSRETQWEGYDPVSFSVPRSTGRPDSRFQIPLPGGRLDPTIGAERLAPFYASAKRKQFRIGFGFIHELSPSTRARQRPICQAGAMIRSAGLSSPSTGPLPIFPSFDESGSQGVSLAVTNKLIELLVCFDKERFESALVDLALTKSAMRLRPASDVRHRQSQHERGQITIGRLGGTAPLAEAMKDCLRQSGMQFRIFPSVKSMSPRPQGSRSMKKFRSTKI